VLNEGRIYPPQPRKKQQPEPAQIQKTEIIIDKKETQERNNKKKKSKDNTTVKDKVEPVEQTYLYKPPKGFFQCEIPKSWNHSHNEMLGVHMFSPYSLNGESYDKFVVSIVSSMQKVDITTFSKDHKAKMLQAMERIGEKLLLERERVIDGIEAWDKILENTRYEPKIRHEIMLVHNGYIVSVSLEASPELFESADIQFERILESLKFF
jgi:hypothetical protein